MAKSFSELQTLAIQIRDELNKKKNSAQRVGSALLDIIDNCIQNITDIKQKLSVFEHACSGFKRVSSEAQLPVTPSQEDLAKGFLVNTSLYLYVGTGGNAVNGRYFNVGDIRGPQGEPGSKGETGNTGPTGEKGEQGNSGVTGDTSDIVVINNLDGGESEEGSIKVLAAEQGKVLNKKFIELDNTLGIYEFEIGSISTSTGENFVKNDAVRTIGYINTALINNISSSVDVYFCFYNENLLFQKYGFVNIKGEKKGFSNWTDYAYLRIFVNGITDASIINVDLKNLPGAYESIEQVKLSVSDNDKKIQETNANLENTNNSYNQFAYATKASGNAFLKEVFVDYTGDNSLYIQISKEIDEGYGIRNKISIFERDGSDKIISYLYATPENTYKYPVLLIPKATNGVDSYIVVDWDKIEQGQQTERLLLNNIVKNISFSPSVYYYINNSTDKIDTFKYLERIQQYDSITYPILYRNELIEEGEIIEIASEEDLQNIEATIDNIYSDSQSEKIINVVLKDNIETDGIEISDKSWDNLKLNIIGCGKVITPAYKEYLKESGVNIGKYWKISTEVVPTIYTCISSNGLNIPMFTEFEQIDNLVEILSEEEKTCRLKLPIADTPVDYDGKSYLTISNVYTTNTVQISRVEDGYAYFTFDGLVKSGDKYNINNDYNLYQNKLRYRIFNYWGSNDVFIIGGYLYVNNKYDNVKIYNANRFAVFNNVIASKIRITDFSFKYFSLIDYALSFSSTNNISIDNNRFEYCYNCVEALSNNIEINKNTFKNIYNVCAFIKHGSNDISIWENHISYSGLYVVKPWAIACEGNRFNISYNTFKNYGVNAISSGIWHGNGKTGEIKGVIEYNKLIYTTDYIQNILNYCASDSGAIYRWALADEIIIRYNYIYNYVGQHLNRGIFCDDGCCNAIIYGNIILDTATHYPIDLYYRDNGKDHNIGNFIGANIIDNGIYYQGREDLQDSNIKDFNIIACSSYKRNNNVIENVTGELGDIYLNGKVSDGILYFDESIKNQLSKIYIYKNIRQYIGFKTL